MKKSGIIVFVSTIIISLLIGMLVKLDHRKELDIANCEVGILSDDLLNNEIEIFNRTLDDNNYILLVTCESELIFDYSSAYQKVRVKKAIKGEGISENESINILKVNTIFIEENEYVGFNQGFVNELKKDKEYLIFLDEKVNIFEYELFIPSRDYYLMPYFAIDDIEAKANTSMNDFGNIQLYGDVKEQDILLMSDESIKQYDLFRQKILENYLDRMTENVK